MMPLSANFEMDLGSLLLEKKLINYSQLNDCIERKRIKGGYLSQHLVELGFMKDSELTTCLTCFYGFSYLSLKSYSISEDALSAIPIEIVCDYCVIPAERNDTLLTVVMADPLNKGVLETLKQVSNCQIIVFVSTRAEIIEAIENNYSIKYRNCQLDKFKDDSILRSNLKMEHISNGLFSGLDRRRYKRLYRQLPGECFIYPNVFKTKIINLSMCGILFESGSSIAIGTNMVMNIHLDTSRFVACVIEVNRNESKNIINPELGNNVQVSHEIASFYNFMSEENQDVLARFLRQRLSAS